MQWLFWFVWFANSMFSIALMKKQVSLRYSLLTKKCPNVPWYRGNVGALL